MSYRSAASPEESFSHSWVLGKGHIPLELLSPAELVTALLAHKEMHGKAGITSHIFPC